ncbi:L-type lectin-domain containing receptor kinase IX.1-like [Miscanthus floridulus]|uniref:L-type lectin-domain containing receptor kinase IX.1-like n=1 Tax=Miscanthus floridulus TaxID=154761 RepID=UPI003457A411
MGTKMPLGLSLLFLLCVCCSLFSTHVPRASSLSFNLSFSDPASACGVQINCTNTYIDGGMLELTRNDIDRGTIDSIGRATYAKPVPLWRAGAGGGAKLLASFTTSFTFRITPDPKQPNTGDGMAFFLTPYPSATEIPPGSGGGNLGLLAGGNSTGDSRFVFVAVEFDTWSNGPPADINGNHMGIDNTSIVSMASTSTSSPTGNLTSNIDMTATISYHNGSKLLTADLLINGSSYHVNATIDLSSYLPEEVAVGFSASTGLSAELHRVLTWSFSSTLASSETTATTTHVDGTSNKLPKKLRLLLSVLVPILLFLSLCAAGTSFLVRRRRRRRHEANGSSSDSEEQFDRAELERGVAAGGPKRYTYAELANTTNNFAEEKKLGRGGFGSVYLGQLNVAGQDRAVAIKMLSSESSAQGRREFEAEVRIISRLKHRNLVQLLGWCDSRNGLMLVYELVAKGSLDRHLYSRDTFLTWPERYEIVLGLGSALRYLHKEWEQCIVHGDIKPSNIMLDESHGTKLGDFGLARLVDHGAGWQTTKAVLGTAGYIDPEFVNTRRPSTYSDVYSFGIVLLEIICNRPPVVMPKEAGEEQQPFVLLKWVWGLYGQNATLDAADERLRGDELDELCMERVLVVGLWCAHPDPSERPSIEQAMHVLQSEDKRLLPALPPQMYKTTLDVPIPARAYGALSIDAYSSTCSSATTGNTNPSSESSSSALLRSSHDLP